MTNGMQIPKIPTNDDVLTSRDVKSIKTSTDELRITRFMVLNAMEKGYLD